MNKWRLFPNVNVVMEGGRGGERVYDCYHSKLEGEVAFLQVFFPASPVLSRSCRIDKSIFKL